MRFLSTFSGIEAATVAWTPLGWTCAAVAEIEPFPCAVLKHHYPDVPNLGDVTKITQKDIERLGHIDLVCGGFPCQDLSVAGKRKGLKNDDGTSTRSGLFFNLVEIADWAKARWLVAENVPGLLSSGGGEDFATVVGTLCGSSFRVPADGWRNAGYAMGPKGLVEWFTLDAQYVRVAGFPRAVPQRRRRVFIIRDSGKWYSRPPIFPIESCLCGNPAPSREAGKGFAGATRTGIAGGSRVHTKQAIGEYIDCGVSSTCAARDYKDATDLISCAEVSPCMTAGGAPFERTGNERTECEAIVAMRESGAGFWMEDTVAGTLDANMGCSGHANRPATISQAMSVRRLTPVECERLMGFPDGYTKIPIRPVPAKDQEKQRLLLSQGDERFTEIDGVVWVTSADGPRYKALGNSWAVNCARWVGTRIQMVEDCK